MERLDKLLASQGTWSRKEVQKVINSSRVAVNGIPEKHADRKVAPEDIVTLDGKPFLIQKTVSLMLHKPKGYVSAARDARDKTVLELVPPEYRRKNLFPAGRLDKDTTGLMILTDDGAMAHEILSPKHHVPKSYRVEIDCEMTAEMVHRFAAGIDLNDGACRPAKLEILGGNTGIVTLREGRYHQIKRMFGCCGAQVIGLHRLTMGALALDPALLPGECRPLSAEEITLLCTRSPQEEGEISDSGKG